MRACDDGTHWRRRRCQTSDYYRREAATPHERMWPKVSKGRMNTVRRWVSLRNSSLCLCRGYPALAAGSPPVMPTSSPVPDGELDHVSRYQGLQPLLHLEPLCEARRHPPNGWKSLERANHPMSSIERRSEQPHSPNDLSTLPIRPLVWLGRVAFGGLELLFARSGRGERRDCTSGRGKSDVSDRWRDSLLQLRFGHAHSNSYRLTARSTSKDAAA